MDDISNQNQAIELLQELGLKQYEAETFVALTRQQRGTAKDISDSSEVPRTRVYDAIRVLESKGLVETQHSTPQVFRAVSIDEAVNTLQSEYIERAESLRSTLGGLEPADDTSTSEATHEVWAISGNQGITSRTKQLIEGATDELILVIGHERIYTDQLITQLKSAETRDVTLLIGTANEDLKRRVQDAFPEATVFVSGLDWLRQSPFAGDDTEISRLLLVDREVILVSSFTETRDSRREQEKGVFGRGFNNGLVAIARRLMATGLPSVGDLENDKD